MSAMPLKFEEVEYPSYDGKPMAESDLHRDEMIYLIQALRRRYREAPDVYVTGSLLLYYLEGDPTAVVAPDVFVVKGIPKGDRMSFQLWKEERGPCFIIEVTSESTRHEDVRTKRSRYGRLGVEEYFLHDPLAEYLRPPLQGYRLRNGRYRRMASEPDGSLVSTTTGLRLRREGQHLRLIDLGTGKPLPSLEEAESANRRLSEELRRSEPSLQVVEEELTRLRRELETLRNG